MLKPVSLLCILAAARFAFAILPAQTISIDYLGNLPATDLVYFQGHNNPIVPLPSDETLSPAGWKVAYVQGSSVVLRIKIKNPNNLHTIQATVSLASTQFVHVSDPLKNASLGGAGTHNLTLAPQEVKYVDFTLTGFAAKPTLGWITGYLLTPEGSWVASLPGESPPDWCLGKIWFTFAGPTQFQSVVWHEVLNGSCSWADWASTEHEAKVGIRNGLHNPLIFEYNPSMMPNFILLDPDDDRNGKIDLTGLFQVGGGPIDCRDASGIATIFFQSQGFLSMCEVLWTGEVNYGLDPPQPIDFVTNLLQGLAQTGYTNFGFSFHQVCKAGTQFWDFSCRYLYDPYGQDHAAPAFGWPMPEFWQNIIGGSSYGLVKGYSPNFVQPVPVDSESGATVGVFQILGGDPTPVLSGVF